MQHGGGSRRQDAKCSKGNQGAVEAHDKAVIGADASGQPASDPPQADQLMEIIRRDSDVRNFSGNGRAVTDGNAHVGLGQRRSKLLGSTSHPQ